MENLEHDFYEQISRPRRGRLKVYIGMIAGVGKTYRMLQEAHDLLAKGVDVRIGEIVTHDRKETAALVTGIPVIQKKEVFYKRSNNGVFEVAWSNDGSRIIAGGGDSIVKWFHTSNWSLERNISVEGWISAIDTTPDDRLVIFSSSSSTLFNNFLNSDSFTNPES